MRFVLSLWVLAGAFALSAQPQFSDRMRFFRSMPPDIIMRDLARLEPQRVHVEVDNATTRVLRITLEANRQIGEHDDRAGVLVCLTDCTLRITGGGAGQSIMLRAGQTRWLEAGRRMLLNAGNAQVEMLYIESKEAQL
jgi:hypothetical protein